jgi:predicted porin
MKKTLIATAALLSMAGAAQAQMTIYGLVDLSYGKSLLADLANEKADFHSGGDNGNSEGNSTTRIGLKGSYEATKDLKANFRFESNGITSDGNINKPTLGRQAWAGFSGGFGEVRLGRQDSVPFQVMSDFDFNGASNGVSALTYSGVAPYAPGRQTRSLQYITPAMGGLTAQFGVVPKGNRGDNAKSVFSAAAKLAAGPFAFGASMQTKDNKDAKNFASLAASYDLGIVKLMAGYANGGKIADGGTGKGPSIGIVAPIAGFNIGAHYANNSDSDAKIKAYEIFVNKEIFKNTYAYAELGNWKSTADGGEGSTGSVKAKGFAVGVIFTF